MWCMLGGPRSVASGGLRNVPDDQYKIAVFAIYGKLLGEKIVGPVPYYDTAAFTVHEGWIYLSNEFVHLPDFNHSLKVTILPDPVLQVARSRRTIGAPSSLW